MQPFVLFRIPDGWRSLSRVARGELLVLAVACGAPLPAEEPPCSAAPGDLVISEILVDPDGADRGQEWFEVHNPRSAAVPLQGIALEKSRRDGTGRKLWPIDDPRSIPSGGFLVFGDVADAATVEGVDVGYGDALTALPNRDGYLALRCGSTVVDAVEYLTVSPGTSWSLDAAALDANANDRQSSWCEVPARGESPAGTPGAPNPSCDGPAWSYPCRNGETQRDGVAPRVGDLWLSEIHANPAAVSDTVGEFVEIYAARAVDLNGVRLTREVAGVVAEYVIDAAECLAVEAGSHIVVAAAREDNGGVPVDYTVSLRLPNGPGELTLAVGDRVLDRVHFEAAVEGASYGRDPNGEGAPSGVWCAATSTYGAGDRGSPGRANDHCPMVVLDGQCVVDEVPRPVVAPAEGALVITELMPDPSAVSDAVGEWFEVCATRDCDLNGLRIGDATLELDGDECWALAAGECVVFARSVDPSVNGGVPADFTLSTSLVNGGGSLVLGHGERVLDVVTWSSAPSGVALSLAPELLSAETNDDVDSWCRATTPWVGSAGDRGSPGETNPSCGAVLNADECLDGDERRPLVAPAAGELVITEVMPNPAGNDAIEEWIEVLALADFDLAAVTAGADEDVTDELLPSSVQGGCLPVLAGDYLVIARSIDASVMNDAVWPRMVLNNSTSDSVWLGSGGVLLDHFGWTGSTDGEALCRRDPLRSLWGRDPSGGTPGAANTTCR